MRAERVVLDTNILISAALVPNSVPYLVLGAVRSASGVVLFSDETFDELHTRIRYLKFDRYVSREARVLYLAQLRDISEWVRISGVRLGCRDPDDDKFLETAIEGNADCLVTGDADLLIMSPFRDIVILNPAEFLANARRP